MTTAAAEKWSPIDDGEPDPVLGRVVRGVLGGEVAGTVFALVTMWFSTTLEMESDTALLMMSTVASGQNSIENGTANVVTGVGVHLVLSALFGVIFSLLVPRMRTNGTLLLSAGAYGLAIYIVNFRLLSPVFFPVFQDANQPFEILIHLVYGLVLAPLPVAGRPVGWSPGSTGRCGHDLRSRPRNEGRPARGRDRGRQDRIDRSPTAGGRPHDARA
ncbi:MAG: hypothetical protein U5R31_17315 [Acidimicrobiia bacterium]|nr:hypothetical protein [Acidimicrobiia bacterium]